MARNIKLEEHHSIIDFLCQFFQCQCESREGKIVEIIFHLVIQAMAFYWIVLPVWGFIDKFFDVLSGRG